MRLVVQRVSNASVEVDGEITGKIDKGLMVLVGIGENDTDKELDYMVRKLLRLRVFEDENDKMNVSIQDINGKLLLVPQFTLYGDVSHNNRPNFSKAMNPSDASKLFSRFVEKCSEHIPVETGVFGAYMNVKLLNDGPVTIIIDKNFD
ncbi:D-tyrosyl-tRNA(Tyr) deacylase [Methanobrevibacter sp. 87.7]|uniref:D-aminoacyl-tRNA deacylase n=1 Tax=Methanobrevibacter sp. 87.7 TaxID=387957 RepID=UPI000B4FD85A|nr:D-aminoacyl-tRNA deacylase [Methanobrevibacter sp. 87.7]OWT33342.1 D-tyrosyl-tRNA(Tyr) deacylase [Methanobrevibacter sp. 87.7]